MRRVSNDVRPKRSPVGQHHPSRERRAIWTPFKRLLRFEPLSKRRALPPRSIFPMTSASSNTFCFRSSIFRAISKFSRPAISRMALSTWSECWANATKCRPHGAYRPKIQFLTVRSFAPVQLATNFAREFRSFNSDFNAEAILRANA